MKRALKHGWKPDLPHIGDVKFDSTIHGPKLWASRGYVDLRKQMPPVVDQGQIGSCTANGIAAAYGFLELQEIPEKSGPEQFGDGAFDPVSRLFVYWNERYVEGDVVSDGGAQIRTGIETLQNFGACRETVWPYIPEKFAVQPPPQAFSEAALHRELYNYRLDNTDLQSLLNCLDQGFPFVFGVTLYESFESDSVAEHGIVPMPYPTEQMIGGHCMCCVGYDASLKMFLVRNSWGTEWGADGHCYIPFDYLTHADLAADFWTLRRS